MGELLFLLSIIPGGDGHPIQWTYRPVSDFYEFKPGGSFGAMNIAAFADQYSDACSIASPVTKVGYDSNTTYQVTVSTSISAGVGILLVATAGRLHTKYETETAIYTDYSDLVKNKTANWTSPPHGARAQFFAICSTGYQKEAYIARLQVTQRSAPTQSCSISNATKLASSCWCSDVDDKWCDAGSCCWHGNSCKQCAKPNTHESHSNNILLIVVVVIAGVLVSVGACCICSWARRNSARDVPEESNEMSFTEELQGRS